MLSFMTRHQDQIKGVLNGFDRLRFRGTLRFLANVRGLTAYLWQAQVLLKDFRDFALGLTDTLRAATERLAEAAGRPLLYLPSSRDRQEDHASALAQADGITEGLIGVLSCVEPGRTFQVGPNPARKRLELRAHQGKCLHYYVYLQHPQLGLCHLRLQTWLPFTLHICLNGREWLARPLAAAGVGFVQRDNCFTHLEDFAHAQRLADAQLRTDGDGLLNGLVAAWHPAHAQLFGGRPMPYYWSADETEWASDVLFRSPEALAKLYPQLLRHGIQTFGSTDVLRFLGRKPVIRSYGAAVVQSDLKARPEGTRIKHTLNRNSVKMYDKQGVVLRVETTVNDPRDLKSYRAKEGAPDGPKSWQRLRKGVADLHRRAEVSQSANARYLEALASVEGRQPLADAVAALCQPATWRGRRLRALAPLGASDGRLLAAVSRGEFVLQGFRNRDLRRLLLGPGPGTAAEQRRQAMQVTRWIRLLRGPGLVQRVSKTHRYLLTDQGRQQITALLAARQADTAKLTEWAA
jgi:hypothetical protein